MIQPSPERLKEIAEGLGKKCLLLSADEEKGHPIAVWMGPDTLPIERPYISHRHCFTLDCTKLPDEFSDLHKYGILSVYEFGDSYIDSPGLKDLEPAATHDMGNGNILRAYYPPGLSKDDEVFYESLEHGMLIITDASKTLDKVLSNKHTILYGIKAISIPTLSYFTDYPSKHPIEEIESWRKTYNKLPFEAQHELLIEIGNILDEANSNFKLLFDQESSFIAQIGGWPLDYRRGDWEWAVRFNCRQILFSYKFWDPEAIHLWIDEKDKLHFGRKF